MSTTLDQAASLGPLLTQLLAHSTEGTRRAALSVVRHAQPGLWHQLVDSGLPLFWPQELGGWGLPGTPDAPPLFRKAAAVALTQTAPQALDQFRRLTSTFRTSLLDDDQRDFVAKVTATVARAPPTYPRNHPDLDLAWARDPKAAATAEERFPPKGTESLRDAQQRATALALAWLDLDPRRLKRLGREQPRTPTPRRVGINVLKTVSATAAQWGSAQPMRAQKAVDRLRDLQRRLQVDKRAVQVAATCHRIDINSILADTNDVSLYPNWVELSKPQGRNPLGTWRSPPQTRQPAVEVSHPSPEDESPAGQAREEHPPGEESAVRNARGRWRNTGELLNALKRRLGR